MSWEELFAELEVQWEALAQAELAAEVADRSRLEHARVALSARLRAQPAEIQLQVIGAGQLVGEVRDCGPDWVRLGDARTEYLVPLAAVLAIRGLSVASAPASPVAERLDFKYALRGLARERSTVLVHLVDGTRLHGTFDRVGGDFAELAEHPPGEPRRAGAVRAVAALPLPAIALIAER